MENKEPLDIILPTTGTPEPKEGDKAGPDTEYVNPASEAGQAYIEETTTNQPGVDGNYNQAAKELFDKQLLDEPSVYKEPEDEAHLELACAIEGPCEVNTELRMFSTPEEDFEDKLAMFHIKKVEEDIAKGSLFTRAQVRKEIDFALEKQMEDLKYNMGAQLLEKLLGNKKSKVISQKRLQDINETLELLEEGYLITSPDEVESLRM